MLLDIDDTGATADSTVTSKSDQQISSRDGRHRIDVAIESALVARIAMTAACEKEALAKEYMSIVTTERTSNPHIGASNSKKRRPFRKGGKTNPPANAKASNAAKVKAHSTKNTVT